MLNVYPIRLRFISARLLASVASIFKSAGRASICIVYFKRLTENIFYDMLLLKILNVSERTRMSVVPRSSDVFASQKLAFRSVHGCTLLNRLFQKAYGKAIYDASMLLLINSQRIRTDVDSGEIEQNRSLYASTSARRFFIIKALRSGVFFPI